VHKSLRHAAPGIALLGALCVGGCLDLENTVHFEGDGGVTLVSRMVFDREMEDVVGYVEYLATLSRNPNTASLGNGVCAGLAHAGDKLSPDVTLTTQQSKENDRLICEIRLHTRELPQPLRDMSSPNFFTVEEDRSTREITLTFDVEKLPDVSGPMLAGVMEQLAKNPDFAGRISDQQSAELLERTKKVILAVTKMSLRGRYVQVSVAGGRILATDGKVSDDGRSATFRMTYAELVETLLQPEARKGRKMFVTLSY
jgi:hypothetical protein